jgi:hypothetical protein
MDGEIVEAAIEAASEAQQAESAAVIAQAAAEATVIAAETVIAQSANIAAVAQQQAAEEVREVVAAVETNEEQIAWLRSELEMHRTADREWKAMIETRLSEMTAMAALSTAESLSSTQVASQEQPVAIVTENPESVVAADQPVQVTEEKPRKRKLNLL